jgi:hypothetical protein
VQVRPLQPSSVVEGVSLCWFTKAGNGREFFNQTMVDEAALYDRGRGKLGDNGFALTGKENAWESAETPSPKLAQQMLAFTQALDGIDLTRCTEVSSDEHPFAQARAGFYLLEVLYDDKDESVRYLVPEALAGASELRRVAARIGGSVLREGRKLP